MNRLAPFALLLLMSQPLVAGGDASSTAGVMNQEVLIKDARSKIKNFAVDLKSTLKQGMKSSGPLEAITLCNVQAPSLAVKHSENGWKVSRISLKPRNEDNAPADWQQALLNDFETKKHAGMDIGSLDARVIRDDRFYYLKAIPTAPVCTTCHGKKIAPAIQQQINKLYPKDKAIGFSVGDIRGAFVVSKALDK